MSLPDASPLTWPPPGVPTALAGEAVRLLIRHHDTPEAAADAGHLDAADLAAAAGAEHLAGLRRFDGVGSEVDQVLRWVQRGGGRPAVVAPPLVMEVLGDALDRVLEGLRHRHDGREPTASALNAEAGAHHVADDAVTVRAAIRAGHASLAAMPYYELRYGSRGRRFTGSDTGWLVTLAEGPPSAAMRHVDWLAGVLAVRGMPSLLLERHLIRLADELDTATGHSRWDVLRTAADHLAARRRRGVDDDGVVVAEEEMRAALGDAPDAVLHAGTLIAAAVADAVSGLTPDAEPCVGWLADPDRFPSGWCEAVRLTERSCRVAAAGPG